MPHGPDRSARQRALYCRDQRGILRGDRRREGGDWLKIRTEQDLVEVPLWHRALAEALLGQGEEGMAFGADHMVFLRQREIDAVIDLAEVLDLASLLELLVAESPDGMPTTTSPWSL